MEVTLPQHTLVLMVGPSLVGKTSLANKICFQVKDQLGDGTAAVVSSDDIRQTLVNVSGISRDSRRRHDTDMFLVSRQAFQILNKTVESLMEFPIAKPVIIVDCTAISEVFRKEMRSLAEKYNYVVCAMIFHYATDELLAITNVYNPTPHIRKTVMTQSRRMQREVWRNLCAHKKIVLKSRREAKDVKITVADSKIYRSCQLNNAVDWFIIGDVHANMVLLTNLLRKLPKNCFECNTNPDELILSKNDLKISNHAGLIFVGDLFDKGLDLQETLYFFDQFCDHPRVRLVRGNHEVRIFNMLSRDFDPTDLELPFVDHYPEIRKNATYRKQFMNIYQHTQVFAKFVPGKCAGNQNAFYVTHSPADAQHLGRLSKKAINAQIYYDYFGDKDYTKLANFIHEYSSNSPVPYHVFGHVPVLEARVTEKCIGIDTGAEFRGGRMTAVCLSGTHRRIRFFQSTLNSSEKYPVAEHLIHIPHLRASLDVDKFVEVPPHVMAKVKRLLRDKICFVSGTISPSPSQYSEQTVSLESLQAAFGWYRKSGCAEVVMQPKYMGSRCQFYLRDTWESSIMVSRNGFVITVPPEHEASLRGVHKNLRDSMTQLFGNFTTIILDGEILPWSFMGQGLIDDFNMLGGAMSEHLRMMKAHGFDDAFLKDVNTWKQKSDDLNLDTLTKKDAIKKLGNHRFYQKHLALKKLQRQFIPTSRQADNVKAYMDQMQIYGVPVEDEPGVHYKPFDILRVDIDDEMKWVAESTDPEHLAFAEAHGLTGPAEIFRLVNNDPIFVAKLDDHKSVKQAHEFYNTLTKDMEGVVLRAASDAVSVPFMKVRNPEYLRIIYGPNFQEPCCYDHLTRRKNIKYKLKESEIEWRLGKQMLACRDEKQFVRLACHFFSEESELSAKSDRRL